MSDDRETKRLRGLIERPERCRFWGLEYTITPRLIAEKFGDGQRLVCVTPMATRPNYFVARVDSSTVDVMARSRPPGSTRGRNLLDAIVDAAQEEYGYLADADEEAGGYFPETVDWDVGVTWGEPLLVEDWKPTPRPRHGRAGLQPRKRLSP